MLIRQLEYLVALAQEKHFAHAAERCGISQPSLSAGLRQLEEELGVAIVERGNRFRGFTHEGEIVLQWARRLLGDERMLRAELDAERGNLRGRLRLGVIPSAMFAAAPAASGFLAAHPAVTIDQAEMTSIDILRDLAEFELDAAITYIDNEPLGNVLAQPMYAERYLLATPRRSPFGDRDRVTWREAATLPLCLLRRDMQNRRISEKIFADLEIRPNVGIEASSMMSQFCYVRSGGWSSVIAAGFADWFAGLPELHLAPLVEPEMSHMVGLVVADRQPLSPLVRAFRDHVAASAPAAGNGAQVT